MKFRIRESGLCECIHNWTDALPGATRKAVPEQSLTEGTPEFFPINPGLFEDAIRVPFFSSRCRGVENTRHSFLHNNMGRGLPLGDETVPGKVLYHLFPGNDRQLM